MCSNTFFFCEKNVKRVNGQAYELLKKKKTCKNIPLEEDEGRKRMMIFLILMVIMMMVKIIVEQPSTKPNC